MFFSLALTLVCSASHLDSKDGRIWLQLEWRALERALQATGVARATAVSDVIAFRTKRRQLIRGAMADENAAEMGAGLAVYASLSGDRKAAALEMLRTAPARASFEDFADVSACAYGVLLDESRFQWRKALNDGDLGILLVRAYGLRTAPTPSVAAKNYDGEKLIAAENARVHREDL